MSLKDRGRVPRTGHHSPLAVPTRTTTTSIGIRPADHPVLVGHQVAPLNPRSPFQQGGGWAGIVDNSGPPNLC